MKVGGAYLMITSQVEKKRFLKFKRKQEKEEDVKE